MTRLSKIPAKIALSFCTLFCLWPCFSFSQDVDTAWVRRYNGPGNGDDKAVAIAVDSSGNVYVTGSCFDSTTGYDYCTIKYLPNGDTAWVRRYNGPANGNDYAVSLALVNNEYIYVLGTITDTITNPAGHFNSALLKYSSDGELLWDRHVNKSVPDRAAALTVDKSGNVYVAGTMYFYVQYNPYIFFISSVLEAIKYSRNGDVLWERGWGYCPGSSASSITVDKNGNVFVTGTENLASLCEYGTYESDYVTFKVDSAGDFLWAKYYDGGGSDFARANTVDSCGNVYVVGGNGWNFTLIKFDSSGNQLWLRHSNSWRGGGGDASLMATERCGNVYVVGNYWCCIDFYTLGITQYDSMGNELWVRQYEGVGPPYYREPKGIALDSLGNIYITGYDAWYAATIKYDPQGNLLWEKKYGDSDHWAAMDAIAIDQEGNICVTGSTESDFLTIKYSPLPQLKGDLNLDGVLSVQDVIYSLNYIFSGVLPPAAPSACDVNCDGRLSASDIVTLLRMVFSSAPAPC